MFIKNKTDARHIIIESPQEDGVVSDPEHHIVIYNDSELRVLNVYLPSGMTGAVHRHGFPAIFYEDMPSDHLIIDEIKPGGDILHEEIWPHPGFEYTNTEPPHMVTNLDTIKPYFAFRLEIKKTQFIEDENIQLTIKNFIESKKNQLDIVRQRLLLQLWINEHEPFQEALKMVVDYLCTDKRPSIKKLEEKRAQLDIFLKNESTQNPIVIQRYSIIMGALDDIKERITTNERGFFREKISVPIDFLQQPSSLQSIANAYRYFGLLRYPTTSRDAFDAYDNQVNELLQIGLSI